MNRFRAWLLPAMLALAVFPGAVHAQVEAGAFVGAFLPFSDLTDTFGPDEIVQTHEAGLAIGGRVGTNVSRVTIEGSVALAITNIATESATLGVAATEDQTVIMAGVDALFNLGGGDFFEPFLAVGVGIKNYTKDDPFDPPGFEAGIDVAGNFGVGGRLWLTETAALRVDVRDYISSFDAFELVENSSQGAKLQNDILLTVGVSFRPGG